MNLLSAFFRFLLVLALALEGFSHGSAEAQASSSTLAVTVRDAGGIIPGARVRVTPTTGGQSVRATTDARGLATFTVLAPGTYEVRAEFQGFDEAVEKALVVRAGETRALELVLSVAPFSSTVTVTTANRREQLLLQVAEPTSVVDRAQIEDTGARSVKDVLIEQAGAGVQVNAGGGQGHIALNGIPNSGVLVLVNGRRYLGKDANGNLNLEDLQLAGVQRIEVVKGAASALYGSDALGGVVNVITERGGARGSRNDTTFSAGSHADLRLNDTVSYRGDKGGLSATGGYRTYDGFDLQPQNPQTIGQPSSRWWTGSGSADYQLTPSVFARFFGDYQTRHIDRYYFSGATQLASTVYDSIRDLTRYTLSPEVEFLPTPHTSLQAQYSYGRYLRDETRVFVQSGEVTPQAPWREWNQELKLTARRDWTAAGANHPLQGGFEYRKERLSRGTLLPSTPANPFGIDEKDRDINVFWIQQEVRLGRLAMSGGVRYDDYSDFGSQWSPKATALVALTRQHTVRASFGHGFRPPYFNELYLNTPPFFVGNPDLLPESANTGSAGYAYTNGRAQLTADYFFNAVKNGIVFDLTRQPFTYGNLSRYESAGVNLSGAVTLPGGFSPSASYTYNRRENAQGLEIGGFPKHAAFLKLLWQQPRLGLRANLRAQINSRIPPGVTDTSYQDGYRVWYGQVSKIVSVSRSSVEFYAQVDNLFNERDLFRRQTCPASAPSSCVEGAPLNGANDVLQVWIAPRTFQVGVAVGMDWIR